MYLWRSHKGMCFWIGIIPPGKVPVVACDDGVFVSLLYILPVPLTDAGPTSVGQHHTTNILQWLVLHTHTQISQHDQQLCLVMQCLTSSSLSMVALICSDPGVTVNDDLQQVCMDRISGLK